MNTDSVNSKRVGFIWHLVRLEKGAAIFLLVVVVTVLAAQVIARYIFRAPISWSEEVARLALIWRPFLGARKSLGWR
jgi:TRAP-type C4-dicarboxylate transport system permease small subunit